MDARSDFTTRMIQADGIRLHCTEFGAGPPLVWLHGAGPGASGMQNFGGNVTAFPGRRNLVFDFPRYGGADKPVVRDGLFSYNARQVVAALVTLGVAKATFIGNSMGGATALRIAALRPDLVDRLVVMGSAGAIPEDEPLTPTLLMMVDVLRNGPTRDKIAAIGRDFVHDPALVSEAMIDERLRAASDPELLASGKDTMLKPESLVADLPRIEARTLIIWGREDRVLPLRWAQPLIAGVRNAETRIVPHCGHWVQIEHRDWFNRAVADFLSD